MTGINNLNTLLKEMKPVLVGKNFVFCTVSEKAFGQLAPDAILVFKEAEGVTVVVKKAVADANSLAYDAVWSLITLTVHSDLSAIGFLARISNRLAEAGISINAVSAYYHDHLFVPVDKAEEAMSVLKSLSR